MTMDFGVDIPHRRWDNEIEFMYRSDAAMFYVSTMSEEKRKDNIMMTQFNLWSDAYNFYKK